MVNKNVPRGSLSVVLEQVLFANPFASLLWIVGLLYTLTNLKDGRHRFFGLAYLLLLGVMVLSRSSRPDRIGAMYPVLFAAGAAAIEQLNRSTVRRMAAGLMIASLILGFIAASPVFTPLLPPQALKGYLSAIGFSFNAERGKMDEPIPQWLADRLGWRTLTSDIAGVYHKLSPEEQRSTVHTCGECTQPQRRIPIYVARGPKSLMSKEWKNFKIYD